MSNIWTKRCCIIGLVAAVSLLTCQAENSGFKVSSETGLEPVAQKAAPNPDKKKPSEAPAKKEPTEITAQKETTFDEKTRVAVFIGQVVVKDPQFNLTCDKLTAYLKKADETKSAKPSASPAAAASPADGSAATKNPADAQGPASGLDRAVAEENVVITQDKKDESTGEVTHYVGKGAKADYNAVNGDMVLTGWPQIQQGMNNQVATAESTVMIMNRAGRLKTIGPSKSVIVDQSSDSKNDKSDKSEKAGKSAKPESNTP